MIIDKISAIPTERIQVAVYQAIGNKLNLAAGLAALLGLLIGLAQLGIVMATVSY
ncbi:hypothetical protein [Paraflavitalea speifideaquila]|uniref:hypothetical protein n=1 Tax=Paraflavitalea speifideaquila TaxID=3076558 RepID=UPI0028E87AA0|nr:hypothetical protein [Paraflavitalea speifideiaquila]